MQRVQVAFHEHAERQEALDRVGFVGAWPIPWATAEGRRRMANGGETSPNVGKCHCMVK